MSDGVLLVSIVLGAVVILGLVQAWLNLGAASPPGIPVPWLSGPFGQQIRGDALLFFYSPRCPTCRAMYPHIERLADHEEQIFAVDVIQDAQLARAFGIEAVPTLIRIKDGLIRDTRVGMVPRASIEAMVRILTTGR